MIQKMLTKYWLTLHVAALFFATWVSVLYSNTGWVICLWLAFFAVQAFLLLPSGIRGETLGEARRRSLWSAIQDPFLYAGIALIVFVCLQWLNSGCPLVYVEDAEVWRYADPPVTWLPFSIQPFHAFTVVSLVVVSVTGGILFRNGTGKASKRFFLNLASMVSGCIAFHMVVKGMSGIEPYSAWGGEAKACNWGTCFGFWMLVALGGHLNFQDKGFFKTLAWSFFALLGNLLGVLQFETPLGIALVAVVALAILGYWVFFLRQTSHVIQLKLFSCVLMAAVLTGAFLIFLFPEHPVKAKVVMLAESAYYDRFSSDRQFPSSLAWQIWQDARWIGTGAGGFVHYGQALIEEADWERLSAYDGTVSNDWLQFLTEHGILGTGLFVAVVIVLLIPLFSRLRAVIKKGEGDVFGEMDAYVVSGTLAVAVVFANSFLGSPFQSGAMLVSFVYVLAIVPGFIPAGAKT
ncbi:MAG: O-antigen ligase family protein [Kiritimatiellaeota bacterium]|nr:O-antigen ligase family protein [Kiritimatiellota bacterium]